MNMNCHSGLDESQLEDAEGVAHYHIMTGSVNWAIALGRHDDIQHAQSFLWSDTIYWVTNTDFDQAVALEGTYDAYSFDRLAFNEHVSAIKTAGVKILAPPQQMLVALDEDKKIVASNYAKFTKAEGFDIITWTLERAGPLITQGGSFYYNTISDAIDSDGDAYELLYALQEEVGILGIFSDWPATVTFYANCMKL
jgi:glycerophosphoryl diester phosphodiesterase